MSMINVKYLTKGCKIKEIKTNKQGIIYVRFITCILKKVVLMNNSQKLVSLLILSWFHLTLTCKSFVFLFLSQHTRSILGVISSTKNQFGQWSNSLKRSQSFAIED